MIADVLPDGPTSRGAATSWRVYLFLQRQFAWVLPLVGIIVFDMTWLVAGDGGVDGAGPRVDAAGEGLDLLEALIAEPHSDTERAGAVVAENDDGGVGVELRVGAGGDFAHGHEERVGEAGGLILPRLADI
jgi:hypothetical protein